MISTKKIWWWAFILAFAWSLFLHRKAGKFNYHAEIWADKAGYNVYLPATFIYGWSAEQFPDSIAQKTGLGFLLEGGKVFTKYPYGTALLQTPFWWAAQVVSTDKSGYSLLTHKALALAGAFYFAWGLLLMYKSHRRLGLEDPLPLLFLVLATNVLYYIIGEPAMSHIYSFFAFSLLLYGLTDPRFDLENKPKWLTALALALVLIIRPINLIFALTAVLFFQRFSAGKYIRLALWALPVMILAWLPQAIYYHHLSGAFWMYPYRGEGFSNLSSPKIMEVLFAAENGLFAYSPIWLIYYVGARMRTGFDRLNVVLLILYTGLYATWHAWQLGCGFGHRAWVDLTPLASVGFAAFYERCDNKKWLNYLFVILAMVSIRMTVKYDACFFGEHEWDWNWFFVRQIIR